MSTTVPATEAGVHAWGGVALPGARQRGGAAAKPHHLGNSASKSSAISDDGSLRAEIERQDRRAARFELRRAAAEMITAAGIEHRVCTCGQVPFGPDGVGVRLSDSPEGRRAGLAGLETCGSVHACPVCSAKIASARAEDLGDVLGWARGYRHTIAMVTMTVRHTAEDSLTEVWDAVSKGWEAVTSGSVWASEPQSAFDARLTTWYENGRQADRDRSAGVKVADGGQRAPRGWRKGKEPVRRVGEAERNGVLGWVRATEVTHGEHGWHVHIHAVLVLEHRPGEDAEATETRAKALGQSMHERWESAVNEAGFESWQKSGGLDVTVAKAAEKRLAEYLVKSSQPEAWVRAGVAKKGRDLAREATLGAMKKGRLGGRTPFEILADGDLDLWATWVEGSRGRRVMAWSKGLREMAGLAAEERTDEEIASEELGTEDDTVLVLSPGAWNRVRHEAAQMLSAAEIGGVDGLHTWLRARGVPWSPPPKGEGSIR